MKCKKICSIYVQETGMCRCIKNAVSEHSKESVHGFFADDSYLSQCGINKIQGDVYITPFNTYINLPEADRESESENNFWQIIASKFFK